MAALAAGCGPSEAGGDAAIDEDAGVDAPDASMQPHVLFQIIVEPTNTILEVDLDAPASQVFSATGHYLDNTTEDVSDRVAWDISNSAVGAMTGPTLAVPGFTVAGAEVARVSATLDGVTGEAQITVVAYRQSGAEQDFFFVLPYQDPAGAQDKPLEFSTDIPSADVLFLMDTTGSMIGEIQNLQNALQTIVAPGVQAEIPDSQFGAGAWEDFPVAPYGSESGSDCGLGGSADPDQPFKLFQEITSDLGAVQTAVDSYSIGNAPIGCGDDWPESNIEALYQVATGDGLSGPGLTNVPSNNSGVGGVGFREGTMPIIVQITDALSHAVGEGNPCPGFGFDVAYAGTVAGVAHTRSQAKAALDTVCARAVGVASILDDVQSGAAPLACTGQLDLEDFATSTGARVPPAAWDVPARPVGCAAGQCCTDFNGTGRAPDGDGLCPLVFRVDEDGSGLGAHIVTGIKMLTRFAAFDVTTEKSGETKSTTGIPLASGTTADFIKAMTPNSFQLPPPPPDLPDPTMDTTGFQNVTPGTLVSFNVIAFNDFVPATTEPQIFRATIRVLAGGCTDLDERDVFILVPPDPIVVD